MAAEEQEKLLSPEERLQQWERLGPRFRLQIKRLWSFVPVGSPQMREIQALFAHCERLLALVGTEPKEGK